MNRTDDHAALPIARPDARTTVEVSQRDAFGRGSSTSVPTRNSIPALTNNARVAVMPDDAGAMPSLVGEGTPPHGTNDRGSRPGRATPADGTRTSRPLPPEARTMIERAHEHEAATTMMRSPALTYAQPHEAATTMMRSPALTYAQQPHEAPTTMQRSPAQQPHEAPTTMQRSPAQQPHEAPTTMQRSPQQQHEAPTTRTRVSEPRTVDARTTVAVRDVEARTAVARDEARTTVARDVEGKTTVAVRPPVANVASPAPVATQAAARQAAPAQAASVAAKPAARQSAQAAPVAAKPAAPAPRQSAPAQASPTSAPAQQAAAPAAAKPAARQSAPAQAAPVAAKPAARQSAAAQPAAAKPSAAKLPAAQKPAAQPVAAKAKPATKRPSQPPIPTIAMPAPVIATPVISDSPELYALIRRVALQSDLANAASVLHTGLGELLRARVALAMVSSRGEITSPIAADLRDAAKSVRLDAIATCARDRQILVAERYLLVPIVASIPLVLVVWRTGDAPVLEPIVGTIAGTAASRLAILDHFLAAQAQVVHQAAVDAKTVFRPEALVASRSKHRAGELVNLSPRWTKIALPAILGLGALLIALAAIIQVPSYSRGTVVVRMNGHNVISNAQGRIAEILVTPGQRVAAGDQLIVLDTTAEQQQFAQIDTVFRDQLGAFLVDPTDEAARQSLAGILASHTSAKDTLATKIITAPIDGIVGSILASDIVSAGEHVLTIVPSGSEPSVVAFMPGSDLARIKVGMVLQVQMTGYTHKRAELVITEVGKEVISQSQARKQLGQKLADAVPLPPSTVMIKAKLTSPSFEAHGKTYDYQDGMDGLGEIEVDTKSFLAMVIRTGD